jgi:hypothetical protein
MPAPKKYPEELKDRAVRLVEDLLADPEVEVSITGRVAGRSAVRHQSRHVAWLDQAGAR